MEIIISDDGLEAYLRFSREDIATPPDIESIKLLLAETGVTHGVRLDSWREAYTAFKNGKLQDDRLLIASGEAPVPGEAGQLQFFFDTDKKPEILENDDGSVDFRELDFVKNVQKGQPLVKLLPPGEGKPGKSVKGETIPAEAGKPAQLPRAKNAGPSPADPNVLFAEMDGVVRLSKSKEVIVEDVLTLNGDVDYSTGNLNCIGSLVINGDVKAGFKVHARGDVTIKGTVEDAEVVSGGDILVKKGFVGRGKGRLHAAGSIHIGHIDNQVVKAGEDVTILGEAIQSKIVAGKGVELRGRSSSLIGGQVIAGTFIMAQNIGTEGYVRTELCMGVHTALENAIKSGSCELELLQQNLQRLRQGISVLAKVKIDRGSLPPEKEATLRKLVKTRNTTEERIKACEERVAALEAKMCELNKDAKIDVRGKIFAGTTIHYRNWTIQVRRSTRRIVITPENLEEIQKLVS